MAFPKRIYVKEEVESRGKNYLIAHKDLIAVAEDNMRTIAVYTLERKIRVEKRVEIEK